MNEPANLRACVAVPPCRSSPARKVRGMGPLSDAERYAFDVRGYLVRPRALTHGGGGRAEPGRRRPRRTTAGRLDPEPALQRPPAPGGGIPGADRPSGRARRGGRAVRALRPPRPRLRHRDGAGHERARPPRRGHTVRSGAVLRRAGRRHPLRAGGRPVGARRPSGRRRRLLLRARQPQGGLRAARPTTIRRLAHEVPLAAGDLVVFTEALTHGTLPWQGRGDRRTLLYKYSPGSSTWAEDQRWPPAAARPAHRPSAVAAAATVGGLPPTRRLTPRPAAHGQPYGSPRRARRIWSAWTWAWSA